MAENNIQKKTRGRQKVAMVRIEKETNRLVTFSKRRAGIFKKASELCTLCGVQAAIIVFSPGRKVFSFGHPSVDDIINRYIMGDCLFNQANYQAKTSRILEDPRIASSNEQLTILNNQTELEKKQTGEFLGTRNPKAEEFKWLTPIEELGFEDLKRIRGALDALRNAACQMFRQLVVFDANGTSTAIGSAYHISPEMVGGQNPILTHYGDQSHQIVVAPTNLDEGPNSYDHSHMFIQHPMGVFGDPSLTMGLNAISMDNAGPSMPNPMNDAGPSMPNPLMLGFTVPNFWLPYQGGMGDGQFAGHPPFAPLNMQGMNPMTGQPFSAMLAGAIDPNGPAPPFNYQSGFGTDIERFY